MTQTLDRGYVYRCRKRVNVDVVKIAHDRPTLTSHTSSTRHPTHTVLYILCNWGSISYKLKNYPLYSYRRTVLIPYDLNVVFSGYEKNKMGSNRLNVLGGGAFIENANDTYLSINYCWIA